MRIITVYMQLYNKPLEFGTVFPILISVFCSRFRTPALLLIFCFLGVDLNVLRDVSGNGVGLNSHRRGRAIRSSILGERIDFLCATTLRLGFTGDEKSIDPFTF